MYGNIAVYGLKIDYTIRCLEYICSVSSTLKHWQMYSNYYEMSVIVYVHIEIKYGSL